MKAMAALDVEFKRFLRRSWAGMHVDEDPDEGNEFPYSRYEMGCQNAYNGTLPASFSHIHITYG